MDAAREEKLEGLFEAATALPPEERTAFLEEVCGADATLRAELASLLAHAGEAHDFLDDVAGPAVARLAGAITDAEQRVPATHGDPLVGQYITHFQILTKLGGGGMGVVYKACDTKLGRPVALKFLPPHLAASDEAKERFIQEARAASALDHVNIATVHEIGETEPVPGRSERQLFIAMACYDGETLKKKLTRGPLPVEEALGYAVQVAEALGAAHAAGMVHRDVKPANVIVTGQGQVKLVDFGLAKLSDVELTREGRTMGTVAYMSPEQTYGTGVDHRTDLWSLGVVLYEMLTGQRPFRGANDRTLIHAIRHDTPEPVGRLRPEVPAALAAVLARCLAKAPGRRYPDANALLADLRSVQAGSVVRRRRWRPAGRYVSLVVLLVLMLAGGLYLEPWTAGSGSATGGAPEANRAERRLAVMPLDDLSPDPDDAYYADGLTEELIAQLSKLGDLRVVARASVLAYKDKNEGIAEISRALNVSAALTGSVHKTGDQVRVAVQLLDAEREAPLWSETYDAAVEDIAAVQREIAEHIAYVLNVRIRVQERRQLAKQGTENPTAYASYLKGRYFWNKRDVASLQQSKVYFEQALDLDPTYAQAWTGLANAYTLLGSYAVLTPEEAHPRARAAAEHALSLDDELAEAHNALAATLADYYYDWEAAGEHYRRALALDPSYATAHQWYATNYLQPLGRLEEALAEARQAQTLDPLSPVPQYVVGQALYFARRYDEAEAYLHRLRELYPDFGLIYLYLAQIASLQGRHDEAIEAAEAAHALYKGETGLSGPLGYVYAVADRRDEAQKLLDALDALGEGQHVARRLAPFQKAYIYLGLGQHDRALAAFEQAYEHRVMYMSWLGIEPILDPLRTDPRFQTLLEKMGLAR